MLWLAPEIEITVGEQTRRSTVQRCEVIASRTEPIASVYLELSNARFEWNTEPGDGTQLLIQAGYRGHKLWPLFDGTVSRTYLGEKLLFVWGLCRARQLADTRITRTYQDETASNIVTHLTQHHEFTERQIATVETEIDKLPLLDNTVIQAIRFLARRLDLEQTVYAGPDGTLVWEAPDMSQDISQVYRRGEDLLSVSSRPGGWYDLVVLGSNVWHSQTVQCIHKNGEEKTYFVERVRHLLEGGKTLRTFLLTRRLDD